MVFTQTVLSDRYIAVCHPIRARKIRTKTYGWLLASVAWLFSLGLSSQGSYIQDPIDEYYTTDDRKALKRSSAVRSYSWPVIYFVHLLNENNDRSVSYFISAIFNQNFNLFTIVHLKIVDRWPETVPHSISWEFKFLWFQKDRSNTSSYGRTPTNEIIILIATLTIVELESYESYGISSAGNLWKDFIFGSSLGFFIFNDDPSLLN